MIFTVALEYLLGTPEELRFELEDIDVPALPPVGTIICLYSEEEDTFFQVRVEGLKLRAEETELEGLYEVLVRPF